MKKRILMCISTVVVVGIIAIIIGIFTPYYGVGIRCMA